ncbi:MAG: chloride channel protein [Bacteroides sp.]|nr:chloride channel protein [Bacteroides sp.]MCM1448614.1 chloride channel protein [Bacteroides sp.]
MNTRDITAALLRWRRRHIDKISDERLVLFISFLVGIFTALTGWLLKWIIHNIEYVLTYSFSSTGANWLNLIFPVMGIGITMLFIRYVVRDDISHGVTKILFALARNNSKIKLHNTYSSVFASAITIGFGGSVGAEAPIVLTGSAIGSNLGRLFRLSGRNMMSLVGCGAAGAVAGIFKAPIAGLVFVLEVLMIDLTMGSLLPLLVSCVTAAAVTFSLSGMGSVFEFHLIDPFVVGRIPAYLALGICCGLVALYFTRTMNWLEEIFRSIRLPYKKFLLGGAMLSILIFIFPSLYGEGYTLIELLLNGKSMEEWQQAMDGSFFAGHARMLIPYLILVILMKVFASTATNGGGGCGGIFAPSLFLGCVAGFVFARIWNSYSPFGIEVSECNFAMMGMCGLMSGVMHAPLTGIFLIAELTGGYGMFVPLMMVAVMAYLTIKVFEPHSIYAMRLARRGELLTHHTDRSVLTLMSMDSVIEKSGKVLYPDQTLGDVATLVANSKGYIFPVVNRQMQLVGIMRLDDIRHLVFRPELFQRFRVSQLMIQPPAILDIDNNMDAVIRTFDHTHSWNLPVVDREGTFVGFIRKSTILSVYRRILTDYSND